jgi:tetratricopeptide (TPR) repeat protein
MREVVFRPCLGEALMDLGRYQESQQSLNSALALGDPSGSCQSNIAQLLLLQGAEPQKALDIVDKAIEITAHGLTGNFPYDWRERLGNLIRSSLWAQKAWALALLGRRVEARHAIDVALKSVDAAQAGEPNYYRTGRAVGPSFRTVLRTGVAEAQWRTGMALLAIHDPANAMTHFAVARDNDPKGKYGILSRQQLKLS